MKKLLATLGTLGSLVFAAPADANLTQRDRMLIKTYVRNDCPNFWYKQIRRVWVDRDLGAKWFIAKCERHSTIFLDTEVWAWEGNITAEGRIFIRRKWKAVD